MAVRAPGTSPLSNNATQNLFVLRAANLTLTTDQPFIKLGGFTNYVVTNVVAVNKSGAFGVTCLGGIYTAASKGGDVILSAATSWAALTALGLAVIAPLANLLQKAESAVPILNLTAGNTGALTADIFIQGVVVD